MMEGIEMSDDAEMSGEEMEMETTGGLHLWTLAAEFVHPNDGPEKMNFGTEYAFRDLLKLRGGYRFNYDEAGMTLGAGLNLGVSSYALALGYAYWDFGRLGATHIVSMGFSF